MGAGAGLFALGFLARMFLERELERRRRQRWLAQRSQTDRGLRGRIEK